MLGQRLVEARRELGAADRHARLGGRVERRAEPSRKVLDCRIEIAVGHGTPRSPGVLPAPEEASA